MMHAVNFPIFIPLPNTNSHDPVYGSGTYSLAVDSLSGNLPSLGQLANGQPPAWNIQPGSIVTVDTGANQETVQVTAINTGSNTPNFTATFNKAHAAGFNVYLPKFGNPGPQPNFSIRDNSAVVLYAAVID
jgi:hypothetical protein